MLRDEASEALHLLHRPLRVPRERAAYQRRHTEALHHTHDCTDWQAAAATHLLPDLNADNPGRDGRIKHDCCGPAGLILHTIRVAFCQPLPGPQQRGADSSRSIATEQQFSASRGLAWATARALIRCAGGT